MLATLSSGLLLIVGVINALPAVGLISARHLGSLYGIGADEPNLHVLLAHRAVVLALTGGLILAAVSATGLRPLAYLFGLLSMLSFVSLCLAIADCNAELRRIMRIDIVASGLMLMALVIDVSAGLDP